MNASILLLEDEAHVAESLIQTLDEEGYSVTLTSTLQQARTLLEEVRFQLLLLDVDVPDGNSFEICREIRALCSSVPIVFLSGRSDEESAVRGLSVGANDYIRKPFGKAELLARIAKHMSSNQTRFDRGKFRLDLESRRFFVEDQTVELTPSEFTVLSILFQNEGTPVHRDVLHSAAEQRQDTFARLIDTHVSRIRSKLRMMGVLGIKISSIYGLGYQLKIKDNGSSRVKLSQRQP
jgi:DNA-binding response OmpR family regulator